MFINFPLTFSAINFEYHVLKQDAFFLLFSEMHEFEIIFFINLNYLLKYKKRFKIGIKISKVV